MVLVTLVGHKVWIVGELQDSVDNIANAFWDSYNLALDETEMALPTVHAILAKKQFLRYESSALPDMENLKVKCMVRELDDRHQTQGLNDESFLQDPLTKSLLSLFAANNELDSVIMDEIAAEEQEQLHASAFKLEKIKDTYQQWSQLPRSTWRGYRGPSRARSRGVIASSGVGKGWLWRKGSRKEVDGGAQRVNALLSHLSCL